MRPLPKPGAWRGPTCPVCYDCGFWFEPNYTPHRCDCFLGRMHNASFHQAQSGGALTRVGVVMPLFRGRPGLKPYPTAYVLVDRWALPLSQCRWIFHPGHRPWQTPIPYARTTRGHKHFFLHRVVIGLGAPQPARDTPAVVDHRSRNTLDNRLANLRVVTRAYNAHRGLAVRYADKDLPTGVRLRSDTTAYRVHWLGKDYGSYPSLVTALNVLDAAKLVHPL